MYNNKKTENNPNFQQQKKECINCSVFIQWNAIVITMNDQKLQIKGSESPKNNVEGRSQTLNRM
jgi:hypothetical protein